jgi:hypothetical protein
VLRYEEDLAGARFALTDRLGGVSADPYAEFNLARHVGDDTDAVEENRRHLARRIGLPADRVVFMNQVHGSEVAVIEHPDPARPPEADGLVTRTADVALAVLVADCVPVLLADARTGVVGVAHADAAMRSLSRCGQRSRQPNPRRGRHRRRGRLLLTSRPASPSNCADSEWTWADSVDARSRTGRCTPIGVTTPLGVSRVWCGYPRLGRGGEPQSRDRRRPGGRR